MGSTDELFAAIGAADVDAVRSLLAQDPSLASARDPEGVSALLRARYRFDGALAQAILAAAPPLDVFDAAAFGDVDRLTQLLEIDPSLATSWSGDGFTPLHLAAFFGKPDATRLLLERGADVDARGRGWMTGTSLHSAASGRHVDVARVLLDAGADPDARQSGGWTPLHASAHNGDMAMIELLTANGADPSPANDDGATAISLAEEAGHAEVVAFLRSGEDG